MTRTTVTITPLAMLVLLAGLAAPHAARAQAPAAAAEPQVLTLDEAYRVVRMRNPMLRAAAAVADAAATREASAGLPPDPMFQLGIMNVSLPDLETSMPTSMVPSIQAMQMLPLFGKLGLSERVAGQSTAIARAGAEEAWWEVRSRTAMAFYMIYETDRQLAVMRETLRLLQDFEQVAKAMYSAGEGRQSDVLRAGVEVVRMDAEIRRMEAMRTAAAARLNGLADRPAETAVPTLVFGALPLELPGADTLRAWADRTRPMLAGGRIGVEQADTRGELMRREIWPDPIVGFEYGQRAGDMGTERMGSAMIGFSLPIFAKSRQLRMRDEAAAMQAMAQAELADMRAQVDARIGELLAELERTRTLLGLYRAEILPQARANVQASFSSYRVGSVDFMTLVDAQMTVNEYEQEVHALMAEYGRSIAELEMTVGRELPQSSQMLAEAR
jgi:outer membrane protein TolC